MIQCRWDSQVLVTKTRNDHKSIKKKKKLKKISSTGSWKHKHDDNDDDGKIKFCKH